MTDKTTNSKDFDRIVQLWAGGEHLRAAALAAEQGYDDNKLEELSILCPGIRDHMPAERGDVRNTGTVPGDPVESEMDRLRVDDQQIGDIQRQHKEQGKSPKQALAEADLKPAGTPSNDGQDKPTLHANAEQTVDKSSTKQAANKAGNKSKKA